ncbi:hypothetical protein NE237_023839 [Protea cynaroides]|uniref:Uncharacterized protein n=1 Tax=Protea cynaroides TaxID=273540 RepID=A0A9Q0HDP2_9MAGN|nr:hypothetical protein NE237_023839 [Protea cynaroides]
MGSLDEEEGRAWDEDFGEGIDDEEVEREEEGGEMEEEGEGEEEVGEEVRGVEVWVRDSGVVLTSSPAIVVEPSSSLRTFGDLQKYQIPHEMRLSQKSLWRGPAKNASNPPLKKTIASRGDPIWASGFITIREGCDPSILLPSTDGMLGSEKGLIVARLLIGLTGIEALPSLVCLLGAFIGPTFLLREIGSPFISTWMPMKLALSNLYVVEILVRGARLLLVVEFVSSLPNEHTCMNMYTLKVTLSLVIHVALFLEGFAKPEACVMEPYLYFEGGLRSDDDAIAKDLWWKRRLRHKICVNNLQEDSMDASFYQRSDGEN